MEIQQVFTSYNNPRGITDKERMIRKLKEELRAGSGRNGILQKYG